MQRGASAAYLPSHPRPLKPAPLASVDAYYRRCIGGVLDTSAPTAVQVILFICIICLVHPSLIAYCSIFQAYWTGVDFTNILLARRLVSISYIHQNRKM